MSSNTGLTPPVHGLYQLVGCGCHIGGEQKACLSCFGCTEVSGPDIPPAAAQRPRYTTLRRPADLPQVSRPPNKQAGSRPSGPPTADGCEIKSFAPLLWFVGIRGIIAWFLRRCEMEFVHPRHFFGSAFFGVYPSQG